MWCHLAQTLDAKTLMLKRHACVGIDGIGDGANASKLLPQRFNVEETSIVVILLAQLV